MNTMKSRYPESFPGTVGTERASLKGGSASCYGPPRRRGAVEGSKDVHWEFYGNEWTEDRMDKVEALLAEHMPLWANNYWELWAEDGRFRVRKFTWHTVMYMKTFEELLHKLEWMSDHRLTSEKEADGMTFELPAPAAKEDVDRVAVDAALVAMGLG